MGCTSSSAGNPVYRICNRAQENQAPVDLNSLRRALEGLSAEEVNRPEGKFGWTALRCLALWRARTPEEEAKGNIKEATKLLIVAGADPVGPKFAEGPLSCAILYEHYDALIAILECLTLSAWEQVVAALTAKKACKKGDFVGGEWIEHDGRPGYVTHQVADDGGVTTRQPAHQCMIELDDSTRECVYVDARLVVIPSVNARVKTELGNAAFAAGCGPELLKLLDSLKERRGGYIEPACGWAGAVPNPF